MVKPCNPKRSFPFTETRQPGRAASGSHVPCLTNPLSMAVKALSMSPPSLTAIRTAASALLFQGLGGWPIPGPTGGRRCTHAYGTLLKRGPGARSSWSRSGTCNGLPRPGVARELPLTIHFAFQRRGEFFFYLDKHAHPSGLPRASGVEGLA